MWAVTSGRCIDVLQRRCPWSRKALARYALPAWLVGRLFHKLLVSCDRFAIRGTRARSSTPLAPSAQSLGPNHIDTLALPDCAACRHVRDLGCRSSFAKILILRECGWEQDPAASMAFRAESRIASWISSKRSPDDFPCRPSRIIKTSFSKWEENGDQPITISVHKLRDHPAVHQSEITMSSNGSLSWTSRGRSGMPLSKI